MPANDLYKKIRISEVRAEIAGFNTFVFAVPHGIEYKAGQYLTLIHPENEDIRRSYSITSSPVCNEPLAIGVKRIANGSFSRWLVDHAIPGTELRTIGAGGLFVLPDDVQQYQQLFFFAAGSGITPVYSIIKTSLHQYPQLRLVLVYSNASPAKTIFLAELKALEKNYPDQLQVIFLFSNALQLEKARLHRDLLLQLVSALSVSLPSQNMYYICGPEAYMRLCSYTLQEYGIPSGNIKKENFVTEKFKLPSASPPDKADYNAYISIGTQQKLVTVTYPLSILDAALRQGVVLPYSCKAGRCGNCVARCTTGRVWHSYNEVLTEKDLAKGLVLTCVGHPMGGDVMLSLEG